MGTRAKSRRPTNVQSHCGLVLFVLLTLCVGSKAAAIGAEQGAAQEAVLEGQSQEAVVHQEIPHEPQQQDQADQLNQQQPYASEQGVAEQVAYGAEQAGSLEAESHQAAVQQEQQEWQQQQHANEDLQQGLNTAEDHRQSQFQEQAGNLVAESHQAAVDEQQQQQQQASEDLQQGLNVIEDHSQGQFHGGVVEEIVHGKDNVHDPSVRHQQAAENDDLSSQQIGVLDGEHLMHDGQNEAHQERSQEQLADPQEHQQQIQGGDVEQIIHGGSNVHDPSAHHQAESNAQEGGGNQQVGVVDVEHFMHGEDHNVHAQPANAAPASADEAAKGEFQAVDVERVVHGEQEGEEGHVHDPDPSSSQKNLPGPYMVAVDVDLLGKDSMNVHDPRARDLMASDLGAVLMHGDGVGVGIGVGVEGEGTGGLPMVADGESLMHGAGGHDHDVKQLKFLKTKEQAQAKDPFQDLHELLMHGHSPDDEDDGKDKDDDHSLIRRGKKITYKDIIELGLDEASLKVVDLTKLLLENAREYDDWQRDAQVIAGERPEKSFWEQIGELRKRYLSFGRSDGEAEDLTGTRLDPEKQRWVTEDDEREGPGGGAHEGEDSVLHQMELLGNTAARQDRHKHHVGEDHGSGREQGDL